MAFLNDLDQKITQMGKSAMNTTKNMSASARNFSERAEEENKLESYYASIGQRYIQQNKSQLPLEYRNIYDEIQTSEAKINQLKLQAVSPQQEQQPQYTAAPNPTPQPAVNAYIGYPPIINEDQLPSKYRPLGPWAYFGWTLLFNIPFIGWIIALIKAFGNTENVNLRNFARSMFCIACILFILCLFIFGITGCMAGMASI